jgi:hypothetical protein
VPLVAQSCLAISYLPVVVVVVEKLLVVVVQVVI